MRIKLLPNDVIDDYFNNHLPYRLSMLTAIKSPILESESTKCHQHYWDMRVWAFESSRLASRIFLDFIGLSLKNKKLVVKDNYKEYDVMICDFGGKAICPNNLSINDKCLLEAVYLTGNKSTAHLTYNDPNAGDPKVIFEGVDLICQLLKENLYDFVGREMKTNYLPKALRSNT